MNYYQVRGSARSKKTSNPANPEGWRINRNIGVVADSVVSAIHGAERIISADPDLSEWSVDQVNKLGEVDSPQNLVDLMNGIERGDVHPCSPYADLERQLQEAKHELRHVQETNRLLTEKLNEIEKGKDWQPFADDFAAKNHQIEALIQRNKDLLDLGHRFQEKIRNLEQKNQNLFDVGHGYREKIRNLEHELTEAREAREAQLKRILDADLRIGCFRERIEQLEKEKDQMCVYAKKLEAEKTAFAKKNVEYVKEICSLQADIRTLFVSGLLHVVRVARPPEVMDAVARIGRIIGKTQEPEFPLYCTCNPPETALDFSGTCCRCGLKVRPTRNGIPFCEKCGGYHNNHCPDLMRRG